jgi:hypothetical protein
MFNNNALVPSITQNDEKLWCEMKDLLLDAALNRKKFASKGCTMNCHTICRAIELCMQQLKVVDGCCLGLCQDEVKVSGQLLFDVVSCSHSWLLTPDLTIFDPYPVGLVSSDPIVIPATSGAYKLFGREFYRADPKIFARVMNEHMYKSVRRIADHIEKSRGFGAALK